MLTYRKRQSGVFSVLRRIAQRVNLWWLSMTDEQQTAARMRGVAVVGCVLAATVSLPAISVTYDVKRADATERASAIRFAEADSVRDGLDPNFRSALIDHPWLVSVEYALERDPRDSLTRYADRYRDTAALQGLASFEPSHFEIAEASSDEFDCLATAIYYEARSESEWGQLAVAEVVMNRVKDHRYPNSVCEVVYQGSERTTGCQFSFTCDGSMRAEPRGRAWAEAKRIAANVMMELNTPMTGEATHYHANYVDPIWNSGLIKTRTVGTHIFYRFPRGAEWRMVRERQEERVAQVMQASASVQEKPETIVPADDAPAKTTRVISTSSAPAP